MERTKDAVSPDVAHVFIPVLGHDCCFSMGRWTAGLLDCWIAGVSTMKDLGPRLPTAGLSNRRTCRPRYNARAYSPPGVEWA